MKLSRRKLLLGSASILALGAAGYKLLRGFDDDPAEDFVQSLPASLRGAALDVHVHILGAGTGSTGCWMHDNFRRSIQVRAGLWNLRLSIGQPDLDARYVDYLRSRIRGAGFLKQVVALAQDYVHSPRGERDPARTPFYTPNDYVARLAATHPEFLFGASIHPYRPDALDELDRVASLGSRDGRSNFEYLVELFPRWPNLFADTSALTLITRWRVLRSVAEHTEIHSRLVHGSDFPLPPASSLYAGRIPCGEWWHAFRRENPLRRDFLLKQAFHLPAEIYTRGYDLLRPAPLPVRAPAAAGEGFLFNSATL